MKANSSSTVGRSMERAACSTVTASVAIMAIAPSSAIPVRSSCKNGNPPRIMPRYTKPKITRTVAVMGPLSMRVQPRKPGHCGNLERFRKFLETKRSPKLTLRVLVSPPVPAAHSNEIGGLASVAPNIIQVEMHQMLGHWAGSPAKSPSAAVKIRCSATFTLTAPSVKHLQKSGELCL